MEEVTGEGEQTLFQEASDGQNILIHHWKDTGLRSCEVTQLTACIFQALTTIAG